MVAFNALPSWSKTRALSACAVGALLYIGAGVATQEVVFGAASLSATSTLAHILFWWFFLGLHIATLGLALLVGFLVLSLAFRLFRVTETSNGSYAEFFDPYS